jgi:hypothetical protein
VIHFLLDIDHTLAERNTAVFIALCNEKLKLGIDEARLQTLHYHDFLVQPEVITYRERLGESNFARALNWIELDPQHQFHMQPIKHAVAGVTRLANLGPLTYYTMRKTARSAQLNQQMAQATRAWLTMHHFPDADQVLFCSSPHDKLCQIIEQTVKSSYHLILIDGHYELLLADLSSLNSFLLQRIQCSFTLCAFGIVEVTQSANFEMVAFPAWENIDAFMQAWTRLIEQRYLGISTGLKSRR